MYKISVMAGIYGLLLFFIVTGVKGNQFTDEDNARLPRLFHLDDHDRCLLQKDGLYCLGVFELSPEEPSEVYKQMKEYSSDRFAFNRSRLHRGYCVSTRCPSSERNATLRFERCVNERARNYALSARLHKLNYCTTQKQHRAKAEQPADDMQQLFINIVYAIVVLNLVGTVYDVVTGDCKKKNDLLSAWSVRASWRKLTATYDDGDPRLKELECIQGMRVVAMLCTIYGHANVIHYQYFVTSPNFLENLSKRVDGLILANGTSITQLYVMISSFLTAYNMLLYSQQHKLSFLMLPVLLLKRIIRIVPVYLLIVGYAATWWPYARSGAMSAVIGENSAICRRKFWTHALFLNNLVESHEQCLPPTWFIPVDMHLFFLSCTLTIVICRWRRQALRVYACLFIISSAVCGVVSYITGWQAIVYFALPDNIRGIFRNIEAFGEFYISTWGSLPACFAGLFLAHLHFELQERNYDCNKISWLKLLHNACFPVCIAWVIISGGHLREHESKLIAALYVAVDRPIFCCFMLLYLFGALNINGGIRNFYSWKGWRVPARLSLPVMLCHWLINVVISARPAAYHTSMFDVGVDYVATLFYTYLVSFPISILVEIPVQSSWRNLFKSANEKVAGAADGN